MQSSIWDDESIESVSSGIEKQPQTSHRLTGPVQDVFQDVDLDNKNLHIRSQRQSLRTTQPLQLRHQQSDEATYERIVGKTAIGRVPSIPLPSTSGFLSPQSVRINRRDLSQANSQVLSSVPSFDTQRLLLLASSPPRPQRPMEAASSPNFRILAASSRPTSRILADLSTNSLNSNSSSLRSSQPGEPQKLLRKITSESREVSGGGGIQNGTPHRMQRHLLLERSIDREMKRLGRLSSSNLDKSFQVYEDPADTRGASAVSSDHVERELSDLGPGASQSSMHDSIRENEILSFHRVDSVLHEDSREPSKTPKVGVDENQSHDTRIGDHSLTKQSLYAQNHTNPNARNVRRHRDEAEDEWETYDDFSVQHRPVLKVGLAKQLTSNSLADWSTFDSLDRFDRENELMSYDDVRNVHIHPADPRYEHTYRLRHIEPDGIPVRVPEYRFGIGNSFPNRNAWTPPLPNRTSKSMPINNSRFSTSATRNQVHPMRSKPDLSVQSLNLARTPHDFEGKDQEDQPIQGSLRSHRNFRGGPMKRTPEGVSPSEFTEDVTPSIYRKAVVGPKGNLTGSINGTGAQYAGSSLADGSSPADAAFSSPFDVDGHDVSYREPYVRGGSMEIQEVVYQTQTPAAAGTSGFSPGIETGRARPGFMYSQIRSHRENLRNQGLQPSGYTPQVFRASRASLPLAVNSLMDVAHQPTLTPKTPNPGRPSAAWARPSMATDLRSSFADPQRRTPGAQTAGGADLQHKWGLIFLLLCCLFPPLLLLLGYGALDSLMAVVTDGYYVQVHRREKNIALVIGWVVLWVVLVGVAVGIVVVEVGKAK